MTCEHYYVCLNCDESHPQHAGADRQADDRTRVEDLEHQLESTKTIAASRLEALERSNARARQLAAENNQLRNQYDELHDRTQEQVRKLETEREALHHALNNLMALVRTDYCDYNAWDAAVVALVPGARDGLGVTLAFAYEVERAEKRLTGRPLRDLPGHCRECGAMLTNGTPACPKCLAPITTDPAT